jgi:fluoride exporter
MEKYLVVLLGGAIGSLARYLVGSAIMSRFPGRFPLATFVVNVTGCFLIGAIITSLTQKAAPDPNWRLFLIVGILGGYTTFSSFAWETFAAARDGAPWIGLMNVTASVIFGYLAVWLGAAAAGARR